MYRYNVAIRHHFSVRVDVMCWKTSVKHDRLSCPHESVDQHTYRYNMNTCKIFNLERQMKVHNLNAAAWANVQP